MRRALLAVALCFVIPAATARTRTVPTRVRPERDGCCERVPVNTGTTAAQPVAPDASG